MGNHPVKTSISLRLIAEMGNSLTVITFWKMFDGFVCLSLDTLVYQRICQRLITASYRVESTSFYADEGILVVALGRPQGILTEEELAEARENLARDGWIEQLPPA